MREITIGNRVITSDGRPYFIADIAANHDGDINRAFSLIEKAKEAGADFAKFQNFKASKIVSRNGFDTMKKSAHQASWSKSVYEVYADASLPDDWTERLKEKCDKVGIEYITSPYDFGSVDAVDPYLNSYKIGSGDITWPGILEYISKKGKPVFLATGAADIQDVQRAITCISQYNNKIVLMQCNTNYTASQENFKYINLNVLKTYQEMFPECILGLSDHTYGHVTVLGALALGARVFEKHFTDDNNRVGPDHKFAMNPQTWAEMVEAANILYDSLGDGIKKIEGNEIEAAIVQRRVIYVTHDLNAGDVIKFEDIFPLRPIHEDGIPPYEDKKLIGRRLKKSIKSDSYIRWEDIAND